MIAPVVLCLFILCRWTVKAETINVVYKIADVSMDYGAAKFVNNCSQPVPSGVLSYFPNCSSGVPLACLRVGGVSTDLEQRLVEGLVVGPTGLVIAQTKAQFLNETLERTFQEAGIDCFDDSGLTFFSGCNSLGKIPNQTQWGCANAPNDYLQMTNGGVKHFKGSCESKVATTWKSNDDLQTTCKKQASLLCVCHTSDSVLPESHPPTLATSSPVSTGSPSLNPVQVDQAVAAGPQTFTVQQVVAASVGAIVGVSAIAGAGFLFYTRHAKSRLKALVALELKDGVSTQYSA